MTQYEKNSLGQPVGETVVDWTPPPFPHRDVLEGRYCRLEPMTPEKHASDLYEAFSKDGDGRMWTYLSIGPFDTLHHFREWVVPTCTRNDPQFYAIVSLDTNKALGFGSFMRIDPSNGCVEVGYLTYSPALQKTRISTEAMYLMMKRAFELGYRRYEWKCNSLNQSSRDAALRLGFQFEGIFRQAVVVKGKNRDTAWFSIIDKEWPERKAALEAWLDPSNFDEFGTQKQKLSEFRTNG